MQNPRIWSKNFTLVLCTSFLLFLGFYLIMPSLPVHVKSLGFSQGAVGLVTGIFTLSAVICRPIMGRLLDTKGRKGVFFFGVLVVILATISYPLCASIFLIVFVRLIHGVGLGAILCGLIGNAFGLRIMYALNIIPILFALGVYHAIRSKEKKIG